MFVGYEEPESSGLDRYKKKVSSGGCITARQSLVVGVIAGLVMFDAIQ